MFKKRFISMLVLLAAVATGAMATTVTWVTNDFYGTGSAAFTKYDVTVTPSNNDARHSDFFYGKGVNTFTTTLGNFTKIEIVFMPESSPVNISGWDYEVIEAVQPDPEEDPELVEYTSKLTWTGDAESVSIQGAVFYIQSITFTIAEPVTGYGVSLKEGTDDAANWQGKAGEGEYQALPLEGVAANTAVSVKYNGTKKVKSVKAVKKAPAGPVTYTELNGGEVLHVGDIINLSEEISFNHGDYYMGSYGSPYTVVRADLTIDEYEETVVNEKADGNYYVIKSNDGLYYYFERALGVTDKSDGILVTYNGKSGKWSDYTFTVHEP